MIYLEINLVFSPQPGRQTHRLSKEQAFSGCDLVCLDPDNGMRPKSVSPRSDKSIKYATAEELLAYYRKGYSFKRGTTRDCFFLLQKEHVEKVEQCLDEMLEGNWGRHFEGIGIMLMEAISG